MPRSILLPELLTVLAVGIILFGVFRLRPR
jgi:hypothetical protein